MAEAQAAAVQRLQSFVTESSWSATTMNERRLELLQADARTTMHERGVLILDDAGDRKSGTHTAPVGRQYLGSVGKIDNGIVVVSTVWADEPRYYQLHAAPYTPARRLPKARADPAFRTKPQIALQLDWRRIAAGMLFRAIVADSGYGENPTFTAALLEDQRGDLGACRSGAHTSRDSRSIKVEGIPSVAPGRSPLSRRSYGELMG